MAIRVRATKISKALKSPTKLASFPVPPTELDESQNQIQEVANRFQRREITLTEDQRQKLEAELAAMIDSWKDDRSTLIDKLKEQNDLYEGVTVQTDFPWEGASHLHVPMPKIKAREIKSAISRSVMRPIPFLQANYAGPDELYDQSADFVNDLEDFVEDKIKNTTNVHQVLNDSIIPIIRDGTCPIQIIWETEWETVFDFKTYQDQEEFLKDYPTATEAKVSESTFEKILEQLGRGEPYEIMYEYDVATYDGPKAYLVPLIHFVHYPVYAPDLQDTVLHGKQIWYSDSKLYQLQKMKKFNNEELLTELMNGAGDQRDETWTQNRDETEGITRNGADRKKAKEFEFYELCYTTSLTEDDEKNGTRRKYLIYYHHPTKKVHRIEPYPIRKGRSTYFILRFIRRDNRLLGMSLIDDIADLSQEIDIIHRQRINSRTITHVPSFKAKIGAKGKFDPGNSEFRFRPGIVFWLQNLDDVDQFNINPVDLSGSVDDELLLFNLVDQVTGSISGQSGQANPIDSRAPARKEALLLRQSTNRLDDYAGEMIPTFGKIGQHIIDLYYQYGPARIQFYSSVQDGIIVSDEIDRSKLFNPNVMFQVNGTSVFSSPDEEFNRMAEVYQIIAQDPITAQNPRIRRDALERLLRFSRMQDEKVFIPTDEDLGLEVSDDGRIPSDQDRKAAEAQAKDAQRQADKIDLQNLKSEGAERLELLKGGVQSILQNGAQQEEELVA